MADSLACLPRTARRTERAIHLASLLPTLAGLLLMAPAAAQTPLVPELTPAWTRVGDRFGIVDRDEGTASVEAAEFSPDGRWIVSGAKRGWDVVVWDAETGEERWRQRHEAEVESVSFSRDGAVVVSGGEDQVVRVWQAADGASVAVLPHVGSIEGLRFTHDGRFLVTGAEDGRIRVWRTADWSLAATAANGPDEQAGGPPGVHADINQIDVTAAGLVVTAGRNGEVEAWRLGDDGALEPVRAYEGHTGTVKSVRLSPDERLVAAGAGSANGVRVWDVATGERLAHLPATGMIMETVAFTPDGRFLVTGGNEGEGRRGDRAENSGFENNDGFGHLRFYRLPPGGRGSYPEVAALPVFRQEYLHFAPDGERLATAHEDGTVRVWRYAAVPHPLLADLRPHPRLLLTPDAEARIRALLPQDTLLAALVDVVRQYADAALAEPVVAYRFDEPSNDPGSLRLKEERRRSMFNVLNLALTYRLTGDARYADRAKADLLAAAAFPDWWPPHFLNVGEFSALVALGYDWLYDALTDEERAAIRGGLLRNGLEAGLEAYDGAGFGWWRTSDDNWNQVNNGGLTLAALAVAEDAPDVAAAVLDRATDSIPHAIRSFLPDGAWEEGPTYWAYGTTYNALLLAGLESALGGLQGLDAVDGYAELGRSGLFHVQTVGPTNRYFDFGDAKDVAYFSPVLFWLARHYDEPVYAWFERELVRRDLARMRSGALMQDDTLDRFLALLVVWYSDAGQRLTYDDLAFDAHFDGTAEVGAFRSGWTEDALYLGFKGGTPQANHAHMDLGSFVLDAAGVRWALDLGSDDNGLPGYYDRSGPRWRYFRLNNRGHNTLVLGDGIQNQHAYADVTAFASTPERAHAVVDLTSAYSDYAVSARRGFALLDRSRVLVQDEVAPLYSGYDVRWQMLTEAEITLDGATATLRQDGEALRAEILEPAGAAFETLDATPDDARENPNEGVRALAVRLPADFRSPTTLTVLLTPVNDRTAGLAPPTFRPLNPTSTAVEAGDLPGGFAVRGAAPNPARARTTLRFDLAAEADVHAEVFDVLGRRALATTEQRLASGEDLTFSLDLSALAPGTYLYRLTARTLHGVHTGTGTLVVLP